MVKSFKNVQLFCTILLSCLAVSINCQRSDFGEVCNPTEGPFCNLYQGTVSCIGSTCRCSQEGNAEFNTTLNRCVGLVGGTCLSEKVPLIDIEWSCIENADCFPNQSTIPGNFVGQCECLWGFEESNRKCVIKNDIPEEDRSTMRTTTTQKSPTLPPTFGDYGTQCFPNGPLGLFPTFCKNYERTVACFGYTNSNPGICSCNLEKDAEFHEEWQLCVGLVGSMCFLEANALGRKVCTENADCFNKDQGGEGHNVGKCECLYGWKEDASTGHCNIKDPDVNDEDRLTLRPTTERPALPTFPPLPTKTTTEPTKATTTKPGGNGGNGAIGLIPGINYFLLISTLFVTNYFIF